MAACIFSFVTYKCTHTFAGFVKSLFKTNRFFFFLSLRLFWDRLLSRALPSSIVLGTFFYCCAVKDHSFFPSWVLVTLVCNLFGDYFSILGKIFDRIVGFVFGFLMLLIFLRLVRLLLNLIEINEYSFQCQFHRTHDSILFIISM